MPDDQTPQDALAVETGTPAPAAISPARTAIQAKYDAQYAAAPTDPVDPVVVATATASAQPDYASVIAGLQAQLAELTTRVAQPVAVSTASAAAEPVDWLKLLADGKKSEGEAALAQVVRQLIGKQTEDSAVQQAVQQFEARQDIANFTNTIKSDPANAEVLQMEPYITAAVQQRLQVAQAAGKTSTPADYVTVYKEAVKAEIETARKLIFTFRGEGKAQAASRQREVLAAPNLAPNPVTNRQDAQRSEETPQLESSEDYFAKRQLQQLRQRGMAS